MASKDLLPEIAALLAPIQTSVNAVGVKLDSVVNEIKAEHEKLVKKTDEQFRLLQERILKLEQDRSGAAEGERNAKAPQSSSWDTGSIGSRSTAVASGAASAADSVADFPVRRDRVHILGFKEAVFKPLVVEQLQPQLVPLQLPQFEILVRNGGKSATLRFDSDTDARTAMRKLGKAALVYDEPSGPLGEGYHAELACKLDRPTHKKNHHHHDHHHDHHHHHLLP